MNVDKIPIELMQKAPGEEEYHFGTIKNISKVDYALAEKVNELIDCFRYVLNEIEVIKNK